MYTDVGPNTIRSPSQQNVTVLLDDRVQYKEIRHNNIINVETTVCRASPGPSGDSEIAITGTDQSQIIIEL